VAVSVADAPTQIEVDDGVTTTVGLARTVIVFEALAEHPLALLPVTLYVVVADGLTDMLDEVAPVLHK